MVLKNSKRKQVGEDQEMRTLGILLFTKQLNLLVSFSSLRISHLKPIGLKLTFSNLEVEKYLWGQRIGTTTKT